jgi:glutathione S-transferase
MSFHFGIDGESRGRLLVQSSYSIADIYLACVLIRTIKITFLEVGRLGTSIVAASRLGDEDLCTSFDALQHCSIALTN